MHVFFSYAISPVSKQSTKYPFPKLSVELYPTNVQGSTATADAL
jgi:hypothetical protein